MPEPIIGIDLGTTNSLIAVYEDGGPRVLLNELGHSAIPSVVAVDDAGHLLVGAPAAERLVSRPGSAASRFKPDMGTANLRAVGTHRFTPVTLSALVLTELRQLGEAALGEKIREVVVTVPAWFREPQRRATLEAGQIAGLDVRHLLNEPTAAALAYGLARDDAEQTAVVLDLGGGTFDVTVLELFDGVVDVRASVGDVHLGGEDFTDAVLEQLVGHRRPDAEARGRLRHRVERARRALSTETAVEIDLSDLGAGVRALTRDEVEAWTKPLLQRIQRCVREALLQAGVRAPDLTDVLLVGGATRMPAVAAVAEAALGRPARFVEHVDELVALGAATQAALLRRHAGLSERIRHRCPHPLPRRRLTAPLRRGGVSGPVQPDPPARRCAPGRAHRALLRGAPVAVADRPPDLRG
jgi:molecular chaperone HscC